MAKLSNTVVRKRFVKGLLKHDGNATAAMMDAKPHLTRASARSIAADYLATVDISQDIKEILDKEGVTDKAIAEALKGALGAEKLFETKEGVLTTPDWTNRNTAIVTALKAKRHLVDGGGALNINIGTSIQSPSELERIERLMSDAKMILGKLGYLDKQTAQEADVSRETNGQVVAPQDVT